jgi:hypothetical protein
MADNDQSISLDFCSIPSEPSETVIFLYKAHKAHCDSANFNWRNIRDIVPQLRAHSSLNTSPGDKNSTVPLPVISQ